MLKTVLTPALIALSLAGAAHAGEVSTDAQLAGAAGVAAGQYTVAELQSIYNARLENNQTALNFYLTHGNRSSTDGDAANQLAKLAGVEPGKYNANELQTIINAQRDMQPEVVKYIVSGENRMNNDAVGTVTPGKAQIAARLGLNPADYTLSQLVALDAQSLSKNN